MGLDCANSGLEMAVVVGKAGWETAASSCILGLYEHTHKDAVFENAAFLKGKVVFESLASETETLLVGGVPSFSSTLALTAPMVSEDSTSRVMVLPVRNVILICISQLPHAHISA